MDSFHANCTLKFCDAICNCFRDLLQTLGKWQNEEDGDDEENEEDEQDEEDEEHGEDGKDAKDDLLASFSRDIESGCGNQPLLFLVKAAKLLR